MDTNANDDTRASLPARIRQEPDPQGQAAVLLIESLIHGLIARSVLTIADAVEIIDIAAEVKSQVAEDSGEHPAIIAASLTLLNTMSASLRRDIIAE